MTPWTIYSPWNSRGQDTGVGSCSLHQGIFPTKGSNPGLPHCRQILYQLSHKGSTPSRLRVLLKACAKSFFPFPLGPRDRGGGMKPGQKADKQPRCCRACLQHCCTKPTDALQVRTEGSSVKITSQDLIPEQKQKPEISRRVCTGQQTLLSIS